MNCPQIASKFLGAVYYRSYLYLNINFIIVNMTTIKCFIHINLETSKDMFYFLPFHSSINWFKNCSINSWRSLAIFNPVSVFILPFSKSSFS